MEFCIFEPIFAIKAFCILHRGCMHQQEATLEVTYREECDPSMSDP